MCWSAPKMKAMPIAPAIEGRVDKASAELPAKKDIVKPDDVSGVQYGSSKKQSGQAAAGQSGAQSLKIDLNTGQQTGTGGGLNP
tara:strand:- start:143 stop:394 length:252 start_codon:yes stop_codon:yes gene_type:complete